MNAFFTLTTRRILVAAALLGLALSGCNSSNSSSSTNSGDGDGDRVSIAFVTNQIASFWRIAEVGCKDAGKDLDVDVRVVMPPTATAVEQKRLVEDLIVGGIDGIAISPIDAENQIELLNQWAAQMPLITQDSDAPASDRRMYIGMDNYLAGRMCGELVLKAIPDGGNVMLTIGRLEQDNAKRRRQGVIDVLLGRSEMPDDYDPVGQELKGDKYTIIDTLTDQGDENVAKRKAEDAITTYPELNAMVGLFAYNPPACLQAVKSQGKVGQIQVIGFDEDDVTLQGIKDGHCIGTVVQNPYEYGYKSIEIVKSLIEGDDSVIPENKFIDIPARTIDASNVDEFWDDLKSKTGG
ncbi:MAG: sugar-binding protein [Planctomycetales bacterium]|nr:sugar-binding protein [Planctomycetales bacterium]